VPAYDVSLYNIAKKKGFGGSIKGKIAQEDEEAWGMSG
jgi:hypothetical protein